MKIQYHSFDNLPTFDYHKIILEKELIDVAEVKAGNNEFYIEDAGEVIAKIQFTPTSLDQNGKETITVTHTEVNESYGGQGLGKQLVAKLAEYAQSENKTIISECSYAKKVLESNASYQALLAK